MIDFMEHASFRIFTHRGEITEITQGMSSVIALGTFDGVHNAHRLLIREACKLKTRLNSNLCGAWCFLESPANFFNQTKSTLICTIDEKIDRMLNEGLDFVAVGRFEDFRSMTAEDFIAKILKSKLSAIGVACGFNHRFGYMGAGNSQTLVSAFGTDGISVLNEQKLNGETISSSAIRHHISNGEIEPANDMLGRCFSFSSEVVGGKKLGRKIGFPTINQIIPHELIEIKRGIYATRCTMKDGKQYIGVSNVGIRPTITQDNDNHSLNCETFIVDFNGDLYGQDVKVEFLSYIREEKRFDSIDALSAAIQNDTQSTINYFKKNGIFLN